MLKFQLVDGSWRLFDSTAVAQKEIEAALRAGDSEEKWKQADAIVAELAALTELIDEGIEKAALAADDATNAADTATAGNAAKLAAQHADSVVASIKKAIEVGNKARSVRAKAEGVGLKNRMEELYESSRELMPLGITALRSKVIARRAAARKSRE